MVGSGHLVGVGWSKWTRKTKVSGVTQRVEIQTPLANVNGFGLDVL